VFLLFDDLVAVADSLSTMAERFFFCRLDLVIESCLPIFAVDRDVALIRFKDGSAFLFFVLGMTFGITRTVYTTTLKQPMHVLTIADVQTLIFKHTLLNIFKQAVGPGVLQTFSTCAVKHS